MIKKELKELIILSYVRQVIRISPGKLAVPAFLDEATLNNGITPVDQPVSLKFVSSLQYFKIETELFSLILLIVDSVEMRQYSSQFYPAGVEHFAAASFNL